MYSSEERKIIEDAQRGLALLKKLSEAGRIGSSGLSSALIKNDRPAGHVLLKSQPAERVGVSLSELYVDEPFTREFGAISKRDDGAESAIGAGLHKMVTGDPEPRATDADGWERITKRIGDRHSGGGAPLGEVFDDSSKIEKRAYSNVSIDRNSVSAVDRPDGLYYKADSVNQSFNPNVASIQEIVQRANAESVSLAVSDSGGLQVLGTPSELLKEALALRATAIAQYIDSLAWEPIAQTPQ